MYYDGIKHFQDRFFFVTPLTEIAHANICIIKANLKYKLTDLFFTLWSQCHFLMGNGSYIYKEEDLSQNELYLKKQLVAFSKELGYVKGIVPQDESSRRLSKRLTETRLLIDANTIEERKVIFGKFLKFHSLSQLRDDSSDEEDYSGYSRNDRSFEYLICFRSSGFEEFN